MNLQIFSCKSQAQKLEPEQKTDWLQIGCSFHTLLTREGK